MLEDVIAYSKETLLSYINKPHLSQEEKNVLDLAVMHGVKIQQLVAVINSYAFQDLSSAERQDIVGMLHGLCLETNMSVTSTGTF